MRLNLNDEIKVKLTEHGKDIYYHQYDRTNAVLGRELCKPSYPEVDDDGYTTFQLWCFIELYGIHMGMTLPNVIEPLDIVFDAPTIEPEPHYDEWCTDCKEYNQERHCCPRWNKVIEQTIEDLKGADRKWILCVDGNEPKANAECWISTNAKYVRRASYAPKANNQPNGFIVTDGSFGFYEYGKSAKAWMPYTQEPEPYREKG